MNTYETSGMSVFKEVDGKLVIVASFEHGMDNDMNQFVQAPALLEALKEIAKGEGAFSRDPLKHASNTIENMIGIAEKAICKTKGNDSDTNK